MRTPTRVTFICFSSPASVEAEWCPLAALAPFSLLAMFTGDPRIHPRRHAQRPVWIVFLVSLYPSHNPSIDSPSTFNSNSNAPW
jgi:hypothetical protein